jgi:hypothetical protein
MISFSNRVEVPAHVLTRFLTGESVLLDLEEEMYYGLDETGTRIWQVLAEASDIGGAYSQLLAEFCVEPEELHQDLSDLIVWFVDRGLLRIRAGDVDLTPPG